MIGTVLGGIGIFLMGMILLSEGLRSAAGEALRGVLQRFARTPFAALCSGTAVTAVVQSSSATTLTTIGFVSAGLLTFPQGVGLIFGANLGTTSTGWLVSVVGLKVDLTVVAFPLVAVGALMRLLGKGRVGQLGVAVAGFALIFVGIGTLQTGMEGVAERIDLGALAGEGLANRILLVLVGAVMTVVMQFDPERNPTLQKGDGKGGEHTRIEGGEGSFRGQESGRPSRTCRPSHQTTQGDRVPFRWAPCTDHPALRPWPEASGWSRRRYAEGCAALPNPPCGVGR